MGFLHSIAVRYGECDMQRVVFNANYLAYVDEAMARWMAAELGGGASGVLPDDFDYMVKKAAITWAASSTFGDVIELECTVSRWGTTSFDATVIGSVAGTPRFEAVITCVCVDPVQLTPVAVPASVRLALGEADSAGDDGDR